MAIGQASGAAAAVAITRDVEPRAIPFDLNLLSEVRDGLCASLDGGQPLLLCPFRDVETDDPCFVAVNRLGARQALPLKPDNVAFEPGRPAGDDWKQALVAHSLRTLDVENPPPAPQGKLTRGQFARLWWEAIRELPVRQPERQMPNDADGDSFVDALDAQPLDADNDNLMDHLEE